jgi:hypothetical protein
MPTFRSTISGGAAAALSFPTLLQGDSGSVWLVTAPKTGVIVHLSNTPQKAKHRVGYTTAKLVTDKMKPFSGTVTLNMAA